MIQICVLNAAGDIVAEKRVRVDSLADGLALVEALGEWPGARFAVEALGLNRWFVNACRERGYDLVVVDAGRLNLRSCAARRDRDLLVSFS